MTESTKIVAQIPGALTLGGVHHVTAITSSAQKFMIFYKYLGTSASKINRESRRL